MFDCPFLVPENPKHVKAYVASPISRPVEMLPKLHTGNQCDGGLCR